MEPTDLEPRALWSAFLDICAVPHASHGEDRLAEALLARARARGIEGRRDAAGNLILRKPASPGREGRAGLILQAHLDMVAQAEPGAGHDFGRDPIRPRFLPGEPGWLGATGTTLGADDGIGVAAGLAILEDDSLAHGPLELLLTVNEEDGMTGARGLEPGSLKGTLLLNLDGEDEAELCLGCAGGYRLGAAFALPGAPAPAEYRWLRLSVSGLAGGHSAADIHRGRGNAIIALARVALAASGGAARGAMLAAFEGGQAANVIPREATALLGVPAEREAEVRRAAEAEGRAIAASLGRGDPGFTLGLAALPAPAPTRALGSAEAHRLLEALATLPDGVRAMSADFPGLPRLSSNLGSARLAPSEGGGFALDCVILARGALDAEKEAEAASLARRLEAAGATTRKIASYPAWSPEPGSRLAALARAAYRDCHGREPELRATHGGLECALFRPAYPGWDMISIGPDIRFPHSPSEAVDVASVARFWTFLRTLVERAG